MWGFCGWIITAQFKRSVRSFIATLQKGLDICHGRHDLTVPRSTRIVNLSSSLENITLSERSQTRKVTYCDSVYMKYSEQANPQRQNTHWVARGQVEERMRMTTQWLGASFCGDTECFGTRQKWWLHDTVNAVNGSL